METIDTRGARRLALARAGLIKPEWTGLPSRAGKDPKAAAHAVIRRFGYLQLDTISVAGARTHSIVLASRLDGFDTKLGEELLRPGEPLFEHWGHEACWLPMEIYPLLAFRRIDNRTNRWWAPVLVEHPEVAKSVLGRVRKEGPLRSADLDGGVAKRVAASLWATGALAIRERRNFQRLYDLPERVIPDEFRKMRIPHREAIQRLVLRSLAGHGWANLRTILDTFRLSKRREDVKRALHDLESSGDVVPCTLDGGEPGWGRPTDLELAARLRRTRPRPDRGVLLSPFDPVLWDRDRLSRLFDFDYRIEIYTPAAKRKYGYYCLPVLAGGRLIARTDLKADRKAGVLKVLSTHYETKNPSTADRASVTSALDRYRRSVGLA